MCSSKFAFHLYVQLVSMHTVFKRTWDNNGYFRIWLQRQKGHPGIHTSKQVINSQQTQSNKLASKAQQKLLNVQETRKQKIAQP